MRIDINDSEISENRPEKMRRGGEAVNQQTGEKQIQEVVLPSALLVLTVDGLRRLKENECCVSRKQIATRISHRRRAVFLL